MELYDVISITRFNLIQFCVIYKKIQVFCQEYYHSMVQSHLRSLHPFLNTTDMPSYSRQFKARLESVLKSHWISADQISYSIDIKNKKSINQQFSSLASC